MPPASLHYIPTEMRTAVPDPISAQPKVLPLKEATSATFLLSRRDLQPIEYNLIIGIVTTLACLLVLAAGCTYHYYRTRNPVNSRKSRKRPWRSAYRHFAGKKADITKISWPQERPEDPESEPEKGMGLELELERKLTPQALPRLRIPPPALFPAVQRGPVQPSPVSIHVGYVYGGSILSQSRLGLVEKE